MFVVVLLAIAVAVPVAPGSASLTTVSSRVLVDGAAEARARLLEGEFARAADAADDVDVAFSDGAAFTTDAAAWNAWADAQSTKAVALARLGKDAAADVVWHDIAVVRPTWSPDKGYVPPKHVARYQALRDALLAGPTIAVTIEHGGRGEAVFDGRTVVPGTTLDVIAGRHWLGRAGKGRGVVVAAPGVLRVDNTVVVAAPVVTPPPPEAVVVEDSPPLLAIGIGVAAVVVASGVVATVLVLQGQQAPVSNPGGTTVSVDTSALNRPVTP